MISRFMFRNTRQVSSQLSARSKYDVSSLRAFISDADYRMKRYLFIINFVASDGIRYSFILQPERTMGHLIKLLVDDMIIEEEDIS